MGACERTSLGCGEERGGGGISTVGENYWCMYGVILLHS